MATRGKRVSFVCNMCGGKTVTRDAWAEWDVKEETRLIEVELAPARHRATEAPRPQPQ